MSLGSNKIAALILSGSIGDAVMALALCSEIEERNSSIRCSILTRRNAKLIEDMAYAHPFIEVVPVGAFTLPSLCLKLLGKPCTMLVLGAFGSTAQTLMRFAKLRAGTRVFGLRKAADDANPFDQSLVYDTGMLHIDNLRMLANAAGFATKPLGSPVLYEFKASMPKDFLFAARSYLVVHPFASSSAKSFSPHRTRELLLKLAGAFPQCGFVLMGGSENKEEAEQISKDVPRTKVATGLPILEAIGIIKNAAVFVGVDTGTLHLASVMNQKVLALEHNVNPEWLPTYNPNAVILTNKAHCTCGSKNDPCLVYEEGLPYMRCLYEISDEAVVEKVSAQLL